MIPCPIKTANMLFRHTATPNFLSEELQVYDKVMTL